MGKTCPNLQPPNLAWAAHASSAASRQEATPTALMVALMLMRFQKPQEARSVSIACKDCNCKKGKICHKVNQSVGSGGQSKLTVANQLAMGSRRRLWNLLKQQARGESRSG